MRMIEDPTKTCRALAGVTCWFCRALLAGALIAVAVLVIVTSHDAHVLVGGLALAFFALAGLSLYRFPAPPPG